MFFHRALKFALSLFCLVVDALWGLGRGGRTGDAQRRLLIVRVDRIGDFILWMPTARRLIADHRRRGYGVAMVVASECLPLVGKIEGVDEVRALNRKAFLLNPLYRIALLGQVRALGATLALQPTFSRIPAMGDAVVRASGAERRIGWVSDLANTTAVEKFWGDRAYTTLLANPEGVHHEMGRNEALLGALGIVDDPSMAPPVARWSMDIRPLEGGGPVRPYYVLSPGASAGLRRWPARNFAAIADRLHHAHGWTGVICGGAGDSAMARRVMALSGAPLVDLTGRTDLDQLASLIAAAELVVASESGVVHITATVATRCVCVLGGGHYGRFLPYDPKMSEEFTAPQVVYHEMPCFGCGWKCRYRALGLRAAPCMEGITVEAVWEAVRDGDFPS